MHQQHIAIKLNELYNWKETTSGLRKDERKTHLAHESKSILAQLTSLTNSPESSTWSSKDKAFVLYLQGKTLNVFDDDYDKEVENTLSKAIKLDPTLIDAWNSLGESYWKKGELNSARNCFSGALSQKNSTNKVSLRCLSMVLRHIGADVVEKRANIEESVRKAKEAVALDIQDSVSWYILGNAHLTRFFNGEQAEEGEVTSQQSLTDLETALRAYSQSLAIGGNSSNGDLHYNRAVLLTFKEQYALAVEGYLKASEMDPDWSLPRDMQKNIQEFVEQIYLAVNLKGPLKPKRASLLAQTASSISYSNKALQKIMFSQIREGRNQGVLCVKLAAVLSPPGAAPPAVICVDQNGGVGTISLYGIDAQKGLVAGDSICIPNPIAKRIELKVNSKVFEYVTTQTDYTQLQVNGSPYNKDFYASPSLTLSTDSSLPSPTPAAQKKPDTQKQKVRSSK